jgi:integrase
MSAAGNALRVISEGPSKITRATVDAAWRRRVKGQRLVVRDGECRGLALVVNATGMSWVFSYKPRGTNPTTGKRWPSQSITLGDPEHLSPDMAREEAGRQKSTVKAGSDPAAIRKAEIRAKSIDRARTLEKLLADYERALPKRPKLRGAGFLPPAQAKLELAHATKAVADMKAGDKAASAIDAADLRALLQATRGQPGAARHRFGAISRFFDWCQDEGYIKVNPCTLVAKARRPKPVAARTRYLRLEEMARIWHAAEEAVAAGELDPVHRDFVRFLIAVPCRRTEGATLDWSHLDLKAAEWSQPAALTKNGDPHRLHLPPLAMDILRARHEAAGRPQDGVVFPAPRSREGLTTFSAIKNAVNAKAAIGDWRLHDFRRSFATALADARFPEPVLDAVLNHRQSATRGGVIGVYQRAERWPEQREAMEEWGKRLAIAIAGGAKVLPLRSEGA